MNTDHTGGNHLDDGESANLQLLDELRAVIERAEPIPDDSTTLAHAAFEFRSLDAELAQLVHDSATDADLLTVRGDDHHRVLSFTTGEVRVDIEYAGHQLVGQVTPPTAVIIEAFRDDDQPIATATADEFGAFVITGLDAGPLSLRCSAPDGRWSIRTQWTAL